MPDFRVEIANPAKREFRKLSKQIQQQVADTLTVLTKNARPYGAEKLGARPSFLRVPCGDYRIIYSVQLEIRAVMVVMIRHRKDAYKGLDELDSKLAAVLIRVADSMLERATIEGTA